MQDFCASWAVSFPAALQQGLGARSSSQSVRVGVCASSGFHSCWHVVYVAWVFLPLQTYQQRPASTARCWHMQVTLGNTHCPGPAREARRADQVHAGNREDESSLEPWFNPCLQGQGVRVVRMRVRSVGSLTGGSAGDHFSLSRVGSARGLIPHSFFGSVMAV